MDIQFKKQDTSKHKGIKLTVRGNFRVSPKYQGKKHFLGTYGELNFAIKAIENFERKHNISRETSATVAP